LQEGEFKIALDLEGGAGRRFGGKDQSWKTDGSTKNQEDAILAKLEMKGRGRAFERGLGMAKGVFLWGGLQREEKKKKCERAQRGFNLGGGLRKEKKPYSVAPTLRCEKGKGGRWGNGVRCKRGNKEGGLG